MSTISDVRDIRRDQRGRSEWPAATATVDEDYTSGRHVVPLTYVHPITRQAVDVEVVVVNNSSLPQPGAQVPIAADPTDPDRVVVLGDGDDIKDTVLTWIFIVGIALAAALARWTAVARVERLIRTSRPSFAMLATLTWAGRGSVGAQCSVYPLDATAGARPLCTFQVLTSAGLPIEGSAFPVEVRGRPVPGGLLVARCGDRIIRPVRRPLGRGRVPRPVDVIDVPPPLPDAEPPPAGTPVVASIARCVGPFAALFLASAVIATAIAVPLMLVGERRDERLAESGDAVLVRLVSKSSTDLVVEHDPPDGPPMRLDVVGSDEHVVDRLYPAHIDASNNVRLDADGYDSGTTLLLLAMWWSITLGVTWPHVRWWRDARAAGRGQWYRAIGTFDGPRVVVSSPQPGLRGCVAMAKASSPAPGRVFDVFVAGTLDPGAALAVAGWPTTTGPVGRWKRPRVIRHPER